MFKNVLKDYYYIIKMVLFYLLCSERSPEWKNRSLFLCVYLSTNETNSETFTQLKYKYYKLKYKINL